MAHVELSLTGAIVPQAGTPAEVEFVAGIGRWMATVTRAPEPCLVIDPLATILAVSASCSELLGLGDPADATGQKLNGGALRFIDFTANASALDDPEVEKIPPLLAITSKRLARGLIRVQTTEGGTPLTVDAISTPLTEDDQVVASMTFFSAVR